MKYKYSLLLFILLAVYRIAQAQSINHYSNHILELAQKDYSLGREILEQQVLELSSKQWLKTGCNEKYILRGSDGSLYLFKNYLTRYQAYIANSIWSAKLSSLFGITSPACYDIWLPVNGKLRYGIIEQIQEDTENYDYIKVPSDKKWINYFLFRWLLSDEEPQFLLTKTGKFISIDGDEITDKAVIDFDSFVFSEGRFTKIVRLSLREGSFVICYREALGFINYVESLPDDIIAKLCGAYGYEERVKMFVLRKKKLRKEFEDYCQNLAKEEGKAIAFSGPVEGAPTYAKNILVALRNDIAAKELILKGLKNKEQLQRNLNIVASKITSKNGFSTQELRSVPLGGISLSAQRKIQELKFLRENTENHYESLALSLYINQYEQFMPFYSYGLLPLEEVRFIIPAETIDPKVIASNLCLGYSRDLEQSQAKKLEGFQQYSIDDIGDFIEDLALKDANAGWNYIMRGNCYLAYLTDGEKTFALQAYQELLSLRQADPQAVLFAHMSLGYLYELNDQWMRFGAGCNLDSAEEEFKLALEVNQDYIPARLNLLAIYLQKDDFNQAKLQIRQLAKLDPEWKKKEEEINRLNASDMQSLRLIVLDAEANYVMSLAYLIKGERELESKHLSRAKCNLDKFPDNVRVIRASAKLEAAEGSSYFGEIYNLTEKDYNLGNQIIERLNFSVDRKQFLASGRHLKTGSHMKYLLRGSNEEPYFFKIYYSEEKGSPADSILSYKFSLFCGLLCPAYYDFWLPVNGKFTHGLIQENKEGWGPFGYEHVPSDKKWLTFFLFRWLIGNEDIDWLISGSGELINYDMDTLFDNTMIDFKMYEKYNLSRAIRLSLKQGSFNSTYREALGFINYVESLPDDIIAKLCGAYGYEERVKMFVLRKKKLRKEFVDYCQNLAKEEGKVIIISEPEEDASKYAQKVLSGLKESIRAKELILCKLPRKHQLQRNLDIVASKRKNDFSGDYLMHSPIARSVSLARQRIQELRILRDNTEDFRYALALSLYINQYEQFMPFYSYGLLPLEEVRFIIPAETIDPKVIASNLCLGYSRDLEQSQAKKLEGFQQYSIDDIGDFIEDLALKDANAGWNYIMRGNCYLDDMEEQDKPLAIKSYQKVIFSSSSDPQAVLFAHMSLGYLYELNDQWMRFGAGCNLDSAEEEFKLALEVNQDYIPARLNLLAIYLQKDDFNQAKLQIRQLAKLDPEWKKKEEEINRLNASDMQSLRLIVLDAEANYVMSLAYLIKGERGLTNQHLSRADFLGFERWQLDDIKNKMFSR